MMNKFLKAVGAAAIGSTILASGSALADDDDKAILATGFTFCEVDNAAVFPATNVGHESVEVEAECVNQDGVSFEGGAFKGTLEPGQTEILTKLFCVEFQDLSIGGELVRCTVKGDEDDLAQVRGVLHVCLAETDPDLIIRDCGLTEALLTEFEIDDFDEAEYLADNPDVAAAVAAGYFGSGLEHYLAFGLAEGRSPN